MLKFYYAAVSTNARRVWIALLEKQIPFEPIELKLNGDQFKPEFTAINPFQRVPVLVDGELTVVESLAILDYLEAKYPTPALLPTEPTAIARVRMVEMLAVNEIQPATIPLTKQLVEIEVPAASVETARHRITLTLQRFENLLNQTPYVAGDQFTLAEVVAGTLVPALPMFGFDLAPYPKLSAWMERLLQRASWQATTPAPDVIQAALPHIRRILETR